MGSPAAATPACDGERVFVFFGSCGLICYDLEGRKLWEHALGPFREAPKEAAGWLFGAGQLAMTAHDLALWNIAIMNRSLLEPASYKFFETDVLLDAGNATGYGLGV